VSDCLYGKSGRVCPCCDARVDETRKLAAVTRERDEARVELAALRADPVWAKMAAIAAGLGDVHDKLQAGRISRLRAVAVAADSLWSAQGDELYPSLHVALAALQPGDLDSETEGEPK
jgi:hypothetical protein